MSVSYKLATNQDSQLVKDIINQMYGSEYEKRENKDIGKAIDDKKEIYILAYENGKCIGFSGASLNNDCYSDIITPDVAVIDYIFVSKDARDISVSFSLISNIIEILIIMNVKQAIMQVQTYNKQRFFHYALSDKKIIKSTTIEIKGQVYEDQILLIEDLSKIKNMSIRDLMIKAHKYSIGDKIKNS